MCAQMSSPGDKDPPREWWFENAHRIAAFRLRTLKYMGVNVTTVREQIETLLNSFASYGKRSSGMFAQEMRNHNEVQPG